MSGHSSLLRVGAALSHGSSGIHLQPSHTECGPLPQGPAVQRTTQSPAEGIAPPAWVHRPRMKAVIERYIRERQLVDRPATIASARLALNLFIRWLMSNHTEIESLAQVT